MKTSRSTAPGRWRTFAAAGLLCLAAAAASSSSASPSGEAPVAGRRPILRQSTPTGTSTPRRVPSAHRHHHHQLGPRCDRDCDRPRGSSLPALGSVLVDLRGGGGERRRKGKSAKKSTSSRTGGDAKAKVDDAVKEFDVATALGDAIRERADVLRRDRLPEFERRFDAALVSAGLSLGTAGTDADAVEGDDDDEAGGEEAAEPEATAYYRYGHRRGAPASTSSVLVDYFLRTHGGTHAIQSALSLLASASGIACLCLPPFPAAGAAAGATRGATDAKALSRGILRSGTKCQLMQQALLLAAAKHAAGLVGAAAIGASQIPRMGVRDARRYLEAVAADPVGQYLFYCSLLAVWMGWFGGSGGSGTMRGYLAMLRGSVVSIMNAHVATTDDGGAPQDTAMSQLLDALSQSPPPWFLSRPYGGSIVPVLVLGPVLLREVISVLWTISDVLTLIIASTGGATGKLLSGSLSGCRAVLDAFMSLLITSDKWRKADSFQRQRSLASLVSQCSLAMELAMGGILIGDAVVSFWTYAFGAPAIATGGSVGGSKGGRLPFKCALGKIACAHLYLNFMLSKRKKIDGMAGSIR
ncbi:hypothetical protein ACHAWF_003484, partial [Thalassiosira exigua]